MKRRVPLLVLAALFPLLLPAAAEANFVSELTGGATPGFSANGSPFGITTGPDGRIWFTEYNDPGRVGRVNADGTVIELTGGLTPGFSANGHPVSITNGPDGHLWFTEEDIGGPGRVGRVNADGTVTEFTGGVTPGFSAGMAPEGITTGPDGHIWFTELLSGVARINGDGTVTEFPAGVTPGFSANAAPREITSGPDGHIWFTEGGNPGRIGRLNADGTVTEFTGGVTQGFSANSFPYAITTGPDGNIWFTEAANPGRVARLYIGIGAVQEFTGGVTPGFSANGRPEGITTGSNGDIWFTEGGIDRFAFLAPTGTVTEEQSGLNGFNGSLPAGITTGPEGDIWFTEVFDPGGLARVGPQATTDSASSVRQTSVTLNGTLNPGGLAVSACHFDFGTSSSYGSTVDCPRPGPGSNSVALSAVVNGLTPSTTYHYRLVGSTGFATSRGADRTFTTLAPRASPPPPPPPPPPSPVCRVPNVRGLRLVRARRAIVAAHCTVGKLVRKYSRTVKKGRVISEKPRARTKLANKAKVNLVVSRGRRR